MLSPDTSANPRVVVERTPDGQLWLECYENGQRKRSKLTRGIEIYEITDELSRQDTLIADKAKRDAEAAEVRRLAMHRSNWQYINHNYGADFADKTYGRHFAPPSIRRENSASAKAPVGIAPSVDLL